MTIEYIHKNVCPRPRENEYRVRARPAEIDGITRAISSPHKVYTRGMAVVEGNDILQI